MSSWLSAEEPLNAMSFPSETRGGENFGPDPRTAQPPVGPADPRRADHNEPLLLASGQRPFRRWPTFPSGTPPPRRLPSGEKTGVQSSPDRTSAGPAGRTGSVERPDVAVAARAVDDFRGHQLSVGRHARRPVVPGLRRRFGRALPRGRTRRAASCRSCPGRVDERPPAEPRRARSRHPRGTGRGATTKASALVSSRSASNGWAMRAPFHE